VAVLPAVGGFLSSLGPEERDALGGAGGQRSYRRGERVFNEGERSNDVYIVMAGRARVYTVTPEGNEVTLSVRGPGDVIGEMGALDPGSSRSATVVALDPLRCHVIRSSELFDVLGSHPGVTLTLLRLVMGRLRDADRRRTEFGSYGATRRLARVLVDVADEATRAASRRDGSLAGLALSQHELAGLIGASRESVARALAELRGRGLVATGRRAITIRDAAGLRRYAG